MYLTENFIHTKKILNQQQECIKKYKIRHTIALECVEQYLSGFMDKTENAYEYL